MTDDVPDGMQTFYLRSGERAKIGGTPPDEPGNGVRGVRRIAYIALVVSLVGNGVLGYLAWGTKARLDGSENEIAGQVRTAQRELARVTAAALSDMPDVVALERAIDTVSSSVADLEEKLWGFGGAPFAEKNALGDLRDQVDGLRACFNRALSDSFDSFERYVFNEYSFRYWVSRC